MGRKVFFIGKPNFSSTARWRSKLRPYETNIMHTANARLHRVQVAVHDREAAAANRLEDRNFFPPPWRRLVYAF
uniref:Uncharacterized protein n=1 Tax=Trichogramma kaykai TaxID=54128 RepID=A0ABD2VVM8_9HYME